MRDISEQELAVSPSSLEANVIRSVFPHLWWFEMISIGLSDQRCWRFGRNLLARSLVVYQNLFSNVFGPLEINRSYNHSLWVGFVYCGIKDCFITMPVLEQGQSVQCSHRALLVAGLYELHDLDGWEDLLYSIMLILVNC